MSPSATNQRSRIALLVLHAATLCAFAKDSPTIHGMPLDDAWIHQVVARTFATSGTLGYAPGQHGASATSYLWAVLLAFNFRVLHVDPCVYTLALNITIALVSSQLLLWLLQRDAGAQLPSWSLAATAFCAFAGGNVLWFSYSGMEASLSVLLALASIVFFTDPKQSSRTAWIAGVFAGALALTRPESMCFPIVLLLWFRSRPRAQIVMVITPWLIALALYFGSNAWLAHTPLPATLQGRRWLWESGTAGMSRAELFWGLIETWLFRLRNYQLGTSSDIAFYVSLGLCFFGAREWWRRGATGMRMLLAWALIHVTLFAVLMPSPGHGGRYQPLVPIFYLGLVAFGAVTFAREIAERLPRKTAANAILSAALLGPWVGLAAVGVLDWRTDHANAVLHIHDTEERMGELIDQLPEEAKVASFDIGGIGFRSHRPIMDAGGLSDARVAAALKNGRVVDVLQERQIDIIVLPLSDHEELPDPANFAERLNLLRNPAVKLSVVHDLSPPVDVWLSGFGATWNSSPHQVMYRLHFTGLPAPTYSLARADAPGPLDPDGLLSPLERDQIQRNLNALAGAGVMVTLRVANDLRKLSSCDDAIWCIDLGARPFVITPPRSSHTTAGYAQGTLEYLAREYVDAADFGGAAAIATHAVARLVQEADRPDVSIPLPGVPAPHKGGTRSQVLGVLPWGAPLALSVFAIFVAAASWTRRRPARA